MANLQKISNFPADVQNDILNTLKAYKKVTVEYYNGKFHVTTGVTLRSVYPADFKVIETITANDIYSPEEKILNYMETFHDYPVEYKGERDYRMLNEIGYDWSIKFRYDENGNIIRA